MTEIFYGYALPSSDGLFLVQFTDEKRAHFSGWDLKQIFKSYMGKWVRVTVEEAGEPVKAALVGETKGEFSKELAQEPDFPYTKPTKDEPEEDVPGLEDIEF